ncbi:MAG: aspartate-semialdehyde dehydrogenase [Elusimicrobia bacterium]|nr:aspartate-semialdehyde dehydrogenase [Candidatus Obscuribacterium magneticum]
MEKLLKNRTFNVAVVGATGAVGREMIRMLEVRKFPVKSLRLMASSRSLGQKLKFNGVDIGIEELEPKAISNLDVAIFSAGGAVSKEYAPQFASKGIFVVDNSSAWRMDQGVPLVVPEVNPHVLSKDKKIIANPNCSTTQMVVALKPLHNVAKIWSIRVATYQSVSGAGWKGIQDLDSQTRAWAKGEEIPPSKKIPKRIALNVVPQIDVFDDGGYTKEELKMVHETRKIMEAPNMKISSTCVRVPVMRSHSEAVWIETERPMSVEEARELLRKAPGVILEDDPVNGIYPMPINAEGRGETFVGRIRKDLASANGLLLWIVSDNLLKGAALNAVQIAELLVQKGYF